MTTLSLKQVEHIKLTAASLQATALNKVTIEIEFEKQRMIYMQVTGRNKTIFLARLEFSGKSFNELIKSIMDNFFIVLKESNKA